MQDVHLWLLHTNGETKIVIVLSFTEENSKTEVTSVSSHQEAPFSSTASNDEANPLQTTGNQEATIPTITGHEGTVAPTTAIESETNLITSIDEKTDLHDLAEQLFILNEHGKLLHPLLGKLQASLHIFKASDSGDDIVESFSAKVLASQPEPKTSKAPTEFSITLKDMLGSLVPKGHDPSDEITFALGDLTEVIQSSIPRTTRLRATKRAIKLLKETVGLDEEPTFAQRKRQRLDPIGIWK